MAKQKSAHRFPFFGEGLAAARKARSVFLLFAHAPKARERRSLLEGAPRVFNVERWRAPRLLEVGHVGELQWAVAREYRPRGDRWEDGEATTEQWAALAREVERWLRRVDRACPLAFVVAPVDDEYGTSLGDWHRWSSLEAGPSGAWLQLFDEAKDPALDRSARALVRALLCTTLDLYRQDLTTLSEDEQRAKLSAIGRESRKILEKNGGVPAVVSPPAEEQGPSLAARFATWRKMRGQDGDRETRFRDAFGEDASPYDLAVDLFEADRFDDAADVCIDALEGTVRYPDHYLDRLMLALVRAKRWREAEARLPEALRTVPLYSADGTMVAWVLLLERRRRRDDARAAFAGAAKYGTYFRSVAKHRGLDVEKYPKANAALLKRFAELVEDQLTADHDLRALSDEALWRTLKTAGDVGAKALAAKCEAEREVRDRAKHAPSDATGPSEGASSANDAAFAAYAEQEENGNYAALAEIGPPADPELREDWLSSLNNGAVMTWHRRDYALSRRLIEAAGEYASEYPLIFHAAACTYVSLGELDKAIEQVERAAEHDYEGLADMRDDDDLAPIQKRPEFRAVFAKKRR